MKRFKDFVYEKNSENEISYEQFIKDVKTAIMKDFSQSDSQAEEFLELYQEELLDSWRNGYSVREAIAATEIPGVRISDDNIDESYIFTIDDNYEKYYKKIDETNTLNGLIGCETIIDNYYKTYYRKTFSDKRIFERVKNNYNSLINLYEKKLKSI
ncbi:MAG: hypothetical protein ACOC3V_04935 [bacterium]